MIDSLLFILEDVCIVASSIILLLNLKLGLKIYQDCHYKYLEMLGAIKRLYIKFYLLIILIPFIFILDLWYVRLIYLVYLVVIYLKLKRFKFITKLKFTSRIIRQCIFSVVFLTILGTLLMMFVKLNSLISLLALFIVASPVLTFIIGVLVYPIEALVRNNYKLQAKRKLKKYKPTVIGITGSCGKTSIKNIVFDLINNDVMAYMSKKSYNTVNGLSMTINDYVSKEDLILVLEMGATKTNDISELVKFTHPEVGIVSEIAYQHMNTFKSIEEIVKEKMKLIEGLTGRKIAILNYDNEYIRNYHIKNDCKLITIGSSKTYTYYATNISHSLDGLEFDVNGKVSFRVKTKLVGLHHVNNILLSIACALEFGVKTESIKERLITLEYIKNRLEVKFNGNITIIDDSYNSNHQGFLNALDILSFAKTKKYLITPGIVDAGKLTKQLNYSLGNKIKEVCDEVILINNPSSVYIHNGLIDLGYENIKVVDSYKEAIKLINHGCVLIENDLPDKYFI